MLGATLGKHFRWIFVGNWIKVNIGEEIEELGGAGSKRWHPLRCGARERTGLTSCCCTKEVYGDLSIFITNGQLKATSSTAQRLEENKGECNHYFPFPPNYMLETNVAEIAFSCLLHLSANWTELMKWVDVRLRALVTQVVVVFHHRCYKPRKDSKNWLVFCTVC